MRIQVRGEDIDVHGRFFRTARLAGDGYLFLNDPRPVLAELRSANPGVDLFTFTQRLPETWPVYDYPVEWDNLAVLPVSTYDHWWNHQIRSYPRNRARQAAKKGVVVREVPFDAALTQGIWEIYNECPIRQGRRFRHYGKSVETIHRETATFLDCSVFLGAFLDERLIGFVKLVHDRGRGQANLMNIASLNLHKDKAPTNALIAQAVRSCADRGIAHLVYQSFSYGKRQGDTMSHFKEVNGFSRVDVPRYYVPLSLTGSAVLRLGLHRKWTDRLPAPVLCGLRDLRYAWYSRKLRSMTEAY